MMRRSYVPVLLLATVAVSSSNVIPKLRGADPLYSYGQPHDNILNHRYQINNILNRLFCKQHVSIDENYSLHQFCKVLEINNDDSYGKLAGDSTNDVVSKKDNYNGEGFRKEQWHNYPRQLDRLHRYFDEYDSEKNLLPDPGDPGEYDNEIPLNYKRNKDVINDSLEGTNSARQYDAIITTYPLILKIIFDPMRNEKYLDPCESKNLVTLLDAQIECKMRKNNEDVQQFFDDLKSGNNLKVKRKVSSYIHNYIPNETNLTDDKGMKVDKRIFSLWSRLQSLSHKGHELPHRRHLHALYGLPDAEGGGALTAEPRDGLRRPPGAPLRWG